MEPKGEEIVIEDYFTQDNNNTRKEKQTINNNNKETKELNIENNNENKNILEDNPNDIKILIQENEKLSKIKVPEDIIKDKKRSNELTQKLVKKTKRNEIMQFDEFFKKKRHYLIMTEGGKPVYSRYGDPIENNSIFATLSAMITKFTIFNSDNEKENLNIISNKKNKIVFLKKGQLIFIALSKKNDCTSLLLSQLEYLYNQLMSILTISFYSKLEDNPSKCLSTMSGTENLFEQMIQYSSKSFCTLFNSYQVFNLKDNRDKLNKLAEEYRGDALYCIIMTPYEIISLSRSNQINVISSDLVLIQNLIFCQEMLRTQESYVPICLPGISEQGYIQFYSNFSEENIGIIFVTENQDPMYFIKFQEQYNQLYQRLINENYVEKIMESYLINNSIFNEYNLIKNKEKDIISTEIIMKNLLEKLGKNDNNINIMAKKSITLKETKNKLNINDIGRENIKRVESSNDLKNKVFDGVKYGVILNKKLKQYILLNFDMDFRIFDKIQKKLLYEYNILYDKANEVNENEEFFYAQKNDDFLNVIDTNENFLCIFSYNFFNDYENIGKKTKEILKYIKKNEHKYFILFK